MRFKRRLLYKLIAVVMAAVLLTSCAKKEELSESDDPNIGVWQATTIEMFDVESPADEIYPGGFEIELQQVGKCKLRIEDKEDKYDWSIDGNTVSISSDGTVFVTALINDNEMVIDDFMAAGMKITLHKAGTAPPIVAPEADTTDTGPVDTDLNETDPIDTNPEEQITAAQAVWNGDWYGYIWITEGYGIYEQNEDDGEFFYDAFMSIDLDDNGEGFLEIILEGDSESMTFATVVGDEYSLETGEGYFYDMVLGAGDWWLGISPSDEGNLIVIFDNYHDPELTEEDGFEFMFCFRPWGELWDQEEREGDRLPPGYEAYKEELASAENPVIDNGDSDDDWTGIDVDFTSAELKEIYKTLEADYNKLELRGMSYREISETYFGGAAGELDLEGDTITIYKWRSSDNPLDYLQVSFQKYEGDDERTAGGIGSYFPE
ncbi:MAG TPA: hypothetical protein GXZ59_03740 [Clostridiaceae bacterium]|nr:hypothetical protein [Clostridiaceae bacterium]